MFETPLSVPLLVSIAVMLSFPLVFSVAENVLPPPVRVEGGGNCALVSVLLKTTVPV